MMYPAVWSHMATRPTLNEEEYERIRKFASTPAFARSPEDLLPEE